MQFTFSEVLLRSVSYVTFIMMLGNEYCPRFTEESAEGQSS